MYLCHSIKYVLSVVKSRCAGKLSAVTDKALILQDSVMMVMKRWRMKICLIDSTDCLVVGDTFSDGAVKDAMVAEVHVSLRGEGPSNTADIDRAVGITIFWIRDGPHNIQNFSGTPSLIVL